MNYLMHLFLSGNDPDILAGNLMGDFVKGRLDNRYPPGIRRGIEIHRKIDTFAAGNESFLQSKRRLDPCYGHFRAVLVDLFYDHFLAVHWDEYSSVTLEEFVRSSRHLLFRYEEYLPQRLFDVLPRMFSRHWLLAYREMGGIDTALKKMAGRLRKPGLLAEGAVELSVKGDELLSDFRRFIPEISAYTDVLLAASMKSVNRPENGMTRVT